MAVTAFLRRSSNQKKSNGISGSKLNRAKGGGNFIPPAVKTVFEKGLGSDFSSVRLHHDANAAFLCDKIDARAFTSGQHVFFNAKEFSPYTPSGQQLLAHELAHVKLHSKTGNKIFRQAKTTPLTGLNTETYVYKIDSKLINVILYLLNNSKLVKAYYKGSLAQANWPAAKFIIHEFDQDFADTYNRLHPGNGDDPKTIGGFYHRKTDMMHLKRLSRLGHALHESVHRLGDKRSIGYVGSFINEGITQLITDIILIENKLKKETDHAYQINVDCANKLIEMSDVDKLFAHYFTYDKTYITFLADKIKKKNLTPPLPQTLVGC